MEKVSNSTGCEYAATSMNTIVRIKVSARLQCLDHAVSHAGLVMSAASNVIICLSFDIVCFVVRMKPHVA